jgi:hypothetical protein
MVAPNVANAVAQPFRMGIKTTTFTGALRRSGMTAPMMLDGPMNGAAFLAYVE